MAPAPDGISTKKRRLAYYVPYASIVCFASEMAGLGVWDSFTNRALADISVSLNTLGVAIRTKLVWGKDAVALTTAITVILALGMLALGVGRSVIAFQADRTGATRMGGRLMTWMWLCAIFIGLWWTLTMWFMLLLLGELLWSAGAYVITSAARVGADTASHIAPGAAVLINMTKGGQLCSTRCVDLSVFDFALGNSTCLCNLDAIRTADTQMHTALVQMQGSIVGAVMMLVAGGWVLMTSASEFGVTRRERQLLRRIAKARVAQGASETARLLGKTERSGSVMGKAGSKGGKPANGPQVLVDEETGEVLDVDMAPGGDTPAAPAEGASAKAGKGSNSPGDGKLHAPKWAKGITKSVTSGLAKGTRVFEMLGGVLKR